MFGRRQRILKANADELHHMYQSDETLLRMLTLPNLSVSNDRIGDI